MAATEGIKQHQSTWSPYDNNGGTCIAIAGANYCVIAADTRMSTGYSILTRDYSKICNLSDKCVMGSSGFQADVKALQKNLSARHLIYQHQHNKQMSCPAMAQLLSNTLYYKRFFPYYSFNVLGGLDNEGKGCVFTYDAVGSYERVGYGAQGTGGTLMMPVLDNQLKSPSPLLLPAQSLKPKPISVGPWGSSMWDDKHENTWNDWMYSGIRQIIVVYAEYVICSINIEYDNNGSPFWLKHGPGQSRGEHTEKIQLDYPTEILTSISGCYDNCAIRSLTFKSNLKEYGPYARGSGICFSIPISDGKIVGFHGRSNKSFLCDIGVYLSNLHSAVPPKSLKPISVGPWGCKLEDIDSFGRKLQRWDDWMYSGIRQIIVVYDEYGLRSIEIEYDNNGSPLSLKHGRSGGNNIKKIQLDYPREILTSISGSYDTKGIRPLTSLTFKSNVKEYGIYTTEHDNILSRESRRGFSIPISEGEIVAFHGWSDEYLHCIGVYLSNLHTTVPHTAVPPKDATTPLLESEAVDLVKDVFASAAERDIYTGDGLEIVVVNAEGVKREFLELRRD